MRNKYRIKEVINEYGRFFFIQRKTIFGWVKQYGQTFSSLDAAQAFYLKTLHRKVIIHKIREGEK